MKKTFLLIAIVLLISCKSIMKMSYGITEPKNENQKSLTNYLVSKKMNIDNILFVDTETSYIEYIKDFGSVPEAKIFDTNGYPISYKKENQDCNAGLFSTIPELNLNSKLKPVEGKNLNEFLENLIDFNGNKVIELPKADFYLFISWAKFTGKLNKDHVKEWEELAAKNKSVKIKVYKVNLDLKEGW